MVVTAPRLFFEVVFRARMRQAAIQCLAIFGTPAVAIAGVYGVLSQRPVDSTIFAAGLYWLAGALAAVIALIAFAVFLKILSAAASRLLSESGRPERLVVDERGVHTPTLGFVPWPEVEQFEEARADGLAMGWWRFRRVGGIQWDIEWAPSSAGGSGQVLEDLVSLHWCAALNALNPDGSPRYFWASIARPAWERVTKDLAMWCAGVGAVLGFTLLGHSAGGLVLVPLLAGLGWLGAVLLLVVLETLSGPWLGNRVFFVRDGVLYNARRRHVLTLASCEWRYTVEEVDGYWRRALVFWRGEEKVLELLGPSGPSREFRGGVPALVKCLKAHHAEREKCR